MVVFLIMADEKKGSFGTADRFFSKASGWLSERISAFVAFLFLLFGAGALYATFVVPRISGYEPYLLAAPFLLALIAYYNRTVATVLFIGLLIMFIV